jgi:hypothetical protein
MKSKLLIGFTLALQIIILAAACATFYASRQIATGLTHIQWMENIVPIQQAALKLCAWGSGICIFFYIVALVEETKKRK